MCKYNYVVILLPSGVIGSSCLLAEVVETVAEEMIPKIIVALQKIILSRYSH